MKTATSLTVIAIGAILAFAVTTSPGFLNLQVVGWILMLTGAIGLAVPRNNREWLRRKVVVRSAPEIPPARRRTTRRPPTTRRPAARRRPPAQLGSGVPAQAVPAQAGPADEAALPPQEPASPNAPTEEIEPVTIEEFME